MTSTEYREEPEDEQAKTLAYENELVRRFNAGLPLTVWDKRDAKRIIRERAAAKPV